MARIGPIGRTELSVAKGVWPGVRIPIRHRQPPTRHQPAALASPAQATKGRKGSCRTPGNSRESTGSLVSSPGWKPHPLGYGRGDEYEESAKNERSATPHLQGCKS